MCTSSSIAKENNLITMRVLYITEHNPFGRRGGGSMASHAFLRAFSDFTQGQIDLVCNDNILNESEEERTDNNIKISNIYYVSERSLLKKMLSVFTGEMCRYCSFTRKLLKKSHYDTVVFDHSFTAGPIIKEVKRLGIKTITIHHNFEPDFFNDNSKGLFKYLFRFHVRNNERKAYLNSNLNLFLTTQDLETFNAEYGDNRALNKVIGVFEFDDIRPIIIPSNKDRFTFVITGSLCTQQGIDGIVFYLSKLHKELPDGSKVIIAGRNPSHEVETLCQRYANVELIPNPESMIDILTKADVYICPTRLGSGIKLRIMDGLKMGLPIITYSTSAKGYDNMIGSPFFKIFKDDKDFKKAVTDLYGSLSLINKKDVQELYANYFSYTKGLERLTSIMCSF